MNTRLQVEHGVTELVTGLDLVAWQIRVAAGEPLPDEVVSGPRHGHAIEVRLYAENPYDGFRPTAGRITAWAMPAGPGVRIDAGIEADTDLRPEYDPLLAKLMVHAEDRASAIDRLRRALDETIVGGVQTDAGFLRWLVDDEAFVDGDYDTSLIGQRWGLDQHHRKRGRGIGGDCGAVRPTGIGRSTRATTADCRRRVGLGQGRAPRGTATMSDHEVRVEGERVTPADGWRLEIDDGDRGIARLVNGAVSMPVLVEGAGSDWVVTIRGRRIPVTVRSWRERVLADAETAAAAHTGPTDVSATLPGLIVVRRSIRR